MSDNPFLSELPAPDPASIKTALGEAAIWYEGILAAAEGFEREWKHHGKKYGWKLKIHDGDKALLELTPGTASFRLSLAVRELELEELREDPIVDSLIEAIVSSRSGKEGWGLRIEVGDEESADNALVLVKALATLRRIG